MKNLIIMFAFWSCGTANQNGTTEDSITVKVADHFDIKLPAVMGTGPVPATLKAWIDQIARADVRAWHASLSKPFWQ